MKSFLIFAFAVCVILSCSTAKKNAAAVERVLMDSASRHKVFLAELQLYPCVRDSFTTFLPGGIDSIPFLVIDTTGRARIIDSIQNANIGNCDVVAAASYDAGYGNALKDIPPKRRPDTVRIQTTDLQRKRLDAEQINQLKNEIHELKGHLDESAKQNDFLVKVNQKWIWLFIGAVVAAILSNVAWLYFKMKIL